MARIFTVQLRTTDVDKARTFYAAVLGTQDAIFLPLPEQAQARGARPHWLGYIDVPELDAALATASARGATRLGPSWRTADGWDAAVVRDPGGAVVALAKASPESSRSGPLVVWHQLNVQHVLRAKDFYRELFGWRCDEPAGAPIAGAINHPFAWQSGTAIVGAMAEIAGRPGIHAHWLYHFAVPSLNDALEQVRSLGGLALPPIELAGGVRVAVCDDAQGAAFALLERAA